MQTLRRQGRNFALQLLYQADLGQVDDAAARDRFWDGSKASKKARAFATDLVTATLSHRREIDRSLTSTLKEWKLQRLSVVVRNVLRLSACELLVIRSEPPAAIINEAVELTRTFMDEDSAKFVNSVLDKMARERDEENGTSSRAETSP